MQTYGVVKWFNEELEQKWDGIPMAIWDSLLTENKEKAAGLHMQTGCFYSFIDDFWDEWLQCTKKRNRMVSYCKKRTNDI